jgi:hypothetical protein
MTVNTQQILDEAEVFVDLVLDDDDWVRAEFDALVAACWESPREPAVDRPCPPGGGWDARPPPRWPRRTPILLGLVPPRRTDGRERGPPQRGSD